MSRNKPFFRTIFALLAVSIAAGQSCGSDTGGADAAAIRAACNNSAAAQCDYVARCLPIFSAAQFGDADTCVSRVRLACDEYATLPGFGWTPERFEQCNQHIQQTACMGLEGLGSGPCASVPGSLPKDANCVEGAQCASGYCRHSVPPGASYPSACGTCQELGCIGIGCKDGEGCLFTTQGARCVALQAEGTPCTSESLCATGLSCWTGLCTKSHGEGEPCLTLADCDRVHELACIDDVCRKSMILDIGAPCRIGDQCAQGGVCMSTPASQSTTCVAPIPDGEPCGGVQNYYCRGPARCSAGICKVPSELTCP
jgi:hypothetical protein